MNAVYRVDIQYTGSAGLGNQPFATVSWRGAIDIDIDLLIIAEREIKRGPWQLTDVVHNYYDRSGVPKTLKVDVGDIAAQPGHMIGTVTVLSANSSGCNGQIWGWRLPR